MGWRPPGIFGAWVVLKKRCRERSSVTRRVGRASQGLMKARIRVMRAVARRSLVIFWRGPRRSLALWLLALQVVSLA